MRKFTTIILLYSIFTLFGTLLRAQGLDYELLHRINHSTTGWKPVSLVLSETTIPIALAVPVVMGGYGLVSGDELLLQRAFHVAMASGVNLALTYSLKASLGRERPDVAYPGVFDAYKLKTDFSMPSGHSSAAFATATSLSLQYPYWYIVVPSFVWASAVGYSRMHLGVHYPTDVLAGALLGAGSAWATYHVNEWLWSRYKRKGLRLQKM